MTFCKLRYLLGTLLFLAVHTAQAHPIPDIPVRGSFTTGGAASITVEVDPRCFEADPNTAPSLTYAIYQTLSGERKTELRRKATELVARSIDFIFEPVGRLQPEFQFEFTGSGRAALARDEDVVVLTGEWPTTIAAGLTGWKIRSTPTNKLSVVFQNVIDNRAHPRLAVLFPGETSFTLDLTGLSGVSPTAPTANAVTAAGNSGDAWATFRNFLRDGFFHVLPEGLDHILFVLGLFLLSRTWRPLLLQVTTFTVAHSVTLALATLGWVHIRSSIVEPLIALSIAAVALENIFHPRYTGWRLLVVFGFGLVHGLGFASGLGDRHLPAASLATGLVGFNLGVEAAQVAVITLAFLATTWLPDPVRYRRWIVIPGSAAIALTGLYWAVQRTLG
ncbi:MAG: HupE/UreJ family protein [Chthoniobacter sp.]|nr:HupE/UreJ family protein [Chthoniobacter sp.]